MNQSEFEADLRREGYQVFYGGLRANETIPEHGHDWNARDMVIAGEITITRDGKDEVFRTGDSCMVLANYPHAEKWVCKGWSLSPGARRGEAVFF